MTHPPATPVAVRPALLRLGGVAAVLAAVAVGGWWFWPKSADAAGTNPPTPEPAAAPAPVPLGKFGCAATACHGGPADMTTAPDERCWNGSFTRWQAADPHTQAFAALETELATNITQRMGLGKAAEEVRCLVCHTTPTYAADDSRKHLRAEGVSCEACHGDSSKWLTPHTSWGKAPADRHGMTDLANVGVRAKACAGCHVGDATRDMNHDMIAAGHPRLVFDFAEHLRRLPKHWSPRAEEETHLWRVGRIASAEAACELLASRAERKAPWPEFAESNCAACHHTLPGTSGRTDGKLRWQSVWPVTSPKLAELAAAMQRRGTKPDEVKAKAAAAAKELAELRLALADRLDLSTPTPDRDDLVSLLHALAAEQREKGRDERREKLFAEAFEALRAKDEAGARKLVEGLRQK